MQIDKLSEDHICRSHPKQKIKEWLKQFRYFYFKRAWGGHAFDGDEFQAAFSYIDRTDLTHKLAQTGIQLNDGELPGFKNLNGHKVSILIYEGYFRISVFGTKSDVWYNVSDLDFEVCLELENHFDILGWKSFADKRIESDVCCISRTRYPEFFE